MMMMVIKAYCGYDDIVKLLKQYGAEVNVQDDDGMTALHKAVVEQRRATVKLLLEFGSNINIMDKQGRTIY